MNGTHIRVLSIVPLAFAILSMPNVVQSQQLTGTGMMASGVSGRVKAASHASANQFELGDMLYFAALQPANSRGMYVSAHMEYLDNNEWRPVPVANTELGFAYRSGHSPGVRDYIKFDSCNESTARHVCLFMPYNAASLRNGLYERRYVLRLWDHNNRLIAGGSRALSPDTVEAKRERNNLSFVTVRARACSSPVGNPEGAGQADKDDAAIVFFNTQTGETICLPEPQQ